MQVAKNTLTLLQPGPKNRVRSGIAAAGATAAVMAATAAWVAHRAHRAEQAYPPRGQFVDVDGVRLHYLDRGVGTPVVLLHGNLVHAGDFVVSGLVERVAQNHRVIAFDRPGFGYSERPRGHMWTAHAQAELFRQALERLGISDAVVVGHSWATLVALELALRAPQLVSKLVLLSGYYYPTARIDALLTAPPATPLLGDVLRYTVSPVLARLMLGRTVKTMFAPRPVPRDFLAGLSREMLVRPSQLRAIAQDGTLMVSAAASLHDRYGEIKTPSVIFAGDEDRVVDPDAHACRLGTDLPNGTLHIVPGAGHMVHYAAPGEVAAAVD